MKLRVYRITLRFGFQKFYAEMYKNVQKCTKKSITKTTLQSSKKILSYLYTEKISYIEKMVCDSFDVPAHLNEGSFHGGNAIQYFML